MPWVILAAALCVLVWFWPRNTLIGLAVVGTAGVLAGIAFWGYGVYDERQRELVAITVEPAAEAASRTSPGIACGEGELLVSITNGSGKTVTGVRFNVGAYREGRSTNIAKGNWFDDDHIINPRGTVSACWKAPGLTRDPEGDRVASAGTEAFIGKAPAGNKAVSGIVQHSVHQRNVFRFKADSHTGGACHFHGVTAKTKACDICGRLKFQLPNDPAATFIQPGGPGAEFLFGIFPAVPLGFNYRGQDACAERLGEDQSVTGAQTSV